MLKMKWLAAVITAVVCGGCANKSGPSGPQEWAFAMDKVWELNRIGEDSLGRPAEPRIADDGTLYLHDFDRHLSYVIDADGNEIGTFGPRGEGEGEVPMYINCFAAGDNVVVCAMDKLHFFTRTGQFVRTVPNNIFARFPLAFKSANEYWLAPGALGDAPEGTATVTHVNLTSGRETVVHTFELSDEDKKPTGGALIPGLTPQPRMAYDPSTDRIYYGKNSDTVVCWMKADGSEEGSFSFSATRIPVSDEDKRSHFAGHDIPEEHVDRIIGTLPDMMAYYGRIEVIDGLVYLLGARSISDKQTGMQVDVFAPDGEHLYRGRLQVEDGWFISGNPDNLQLADGFAYAVLANESGDKKIVKYSVALPRP